MKKLTNELTRPRRPRQIRTAAAPLPAAASPTSVALRRRTFMMGLLGGAAAAFAAGCSSEPANPPSVKPPTTPCVSIPEIGDGEDVITYVTRIKGQYDHEFYKAVIGAANEFKEGDDALGIAACDQTSRDNARKLLGNTTVSALADRPMLEDAVYTLIMQATDAAALDGVRAWKMSQLKSFLLEKTEDEIKAVMVGLPSDIIGMIVKLMSNDELIKVGQTVFNPLPGSKIGAKGYMGARIQPNSPTDDTTDIIWQVFNGFAFAVGDVVLGNNPVSSEVASVHAIEEALKDVLVTFKLEDVLPHCCLAHIDVQAEVEKQFPGSTALWFQSLGSTVDANATFDVTVEKMLNHAAERPGKYGLYFETGQGADATNGHGAGFDMVVHESRKYGFARALKKKVADAQKAAGNAEAPWVHLNDVAGFIGPEVFRTKDQLVRCCLEDIVMGKLHGLPIGLDICSTLHMSVDLDDLDWCIDQIMPANPAYLMGLPTKNDPMLSYLTTAFQDHVRIREKFGYKVDDKMWAFFQELGVIDAQGKPTQYFGNVKYVYAKYVKAKNPLDMRTVDEIMNAQETLDALDAVKKRGVFIAEGYGTNPWDLNPELDKYIRDLVADGKKSIYADLEPAFVATIPTAVKIWTGAKDRDDYILHPPTGEQIKEDAIPEIEKLRDAHAGQYDVQIMISEGLNAYSISDPGHVDKFLPALRAKLEEAGYKVAPEHVVCTAGRVRAGYHVGEVLFGKLADKQSTRAIVHIIGERPGSEHRAFSVYMTTPKVEVWAQAGKVDHDITSVLAGLADTTYAMNASMQKDPVESAKQVVTQLNDLRAKA
ncbi:ethanolamine ammonia-lyase subunit EutB [Polyangium sp. 6x1]|uniref:ethanolamine ammonia-lyase subunit EutB n=1 Tax=Polyangium sp. 6x1 TaxID=3042689 RepID=UPI0024824B9F|nr:ethanolamine ammonia-lyase subunit EutB [Polyangium sp. 6x1]MDI1449223.1 ethanolamine ammonia-lyase subunit EutB [Polyangium sp. 6x1]